MPAHHFVYHLQHDAVFRVFTLTEFCLDTSEWLFLVSDTGMTKNTYYLLYEHNLKLTDALFLNTAKFFIHVVCVSSKMIVN
jgi:hypothetical protein